MRSAVLLYNPTAGRGSAHRRIDQLLGRLRSSGFDAEAWATTASGSATEQARDAAASGIEVVLAFGGDGTLRETAAGLIGSETALGFVPGGTINVMALTFGLPPNPLRAADALRHATVKEFDLGLCNDEPFLMQTSAGVDADMIRRLSPRLKRVIKGGAAVPAALGAFTLYGYPRIAVTADGEELDGSLAVVTNIPFYGGRFLIQPDAQTDDRRLDLVLFRGKGRLATAGFSRDLLFGRHLNRPDVEVRRIEEVILHGSDQLPVQIDGDVVRAPTPLHVRLAPERLRVLSA